MVDSFRTIVNPSQLPICIGYNTPTLMVGSCFAENIGEKMRGVKLPVHVNPFGVVYNPYSAALVLERILEGKVYAESDLFFHNNLWLSLDHHTSFSREDKTECLENINTTLDKSQEFWQRTEVLVVTFGTARVYHYKETGKTVANCHRIPARDFTHSLLSVDEIVERWKLLLKQVFNAKPNLKVLFTLSPVRHWKDGATGNQISKSTLFLALNQLIR